MPFKYRPRTADAWDRRANQSSGEFDGFVKEEYNLYKVKKGDNSIRILPPTWDDADHYGIDIYVHYSVGPTKASVLCLQSMKGKACPVCEARTRALKLGDEDAARELKAGKRVLVWMLDRSDEDKGPMLWAMPFSVDKNIAAQARDKQSGEIFALDDPEEGYDVFFERNGEHIQVKYESFQLARRSSSVKSKWLDYIEQRPLHEALIWRDYDEVKALYEGRTGDDEAPKAEVHDLSARRRTQEPERAAPTAAPRRRLAEPAPEDKPAPRRRVAQPEPEQRSRREEINDEVPWEDPAEGEAPTIDGEAVEEPKPAAKSAAAMLRERYARG